MSEEREDTEPPAEPDPPAKKDTSPPDVPADASPFDVPSGSGVEGNEGRPEPADRKRPLRR